MSSLENKLERASDNTLNFINMSNAGEESLMS